MIKTTSKEINKEDAKEYPALLISPSSGKVILAYRNGHTIDDFMGVVVHTPDNNGIGEWNDCWKKDAFEPYNGEITLKS